MQVTIIIFPTMFFESILSQRPLKIGRLVW